MVAAVRLDLCAGMAVISIMMAVLLQGPTLHPDFDCVSDGCCFKTNFVR